MSAKPKRMKPSSSKSSNPMEVEEENVGKDVDKPKHVKPSCSKSANPVEIEEEIDVESEYMDLLDEIENINEFGDTGNVCEALSGFMDKVEDLFSRVSSNSAPGLIADSKVISALANKMCETAKAMKVEDENFGVKNWATHLEKKAANDEVEEQPSLSQQKKYSSENDEIFRILQETSKRSKEVEVRQKEPQKQIDSRAVDDEIRRIIEERLKRRKEEEARQNEPQKALNKGYNEPKM